MHGPKRILAALGAALLASVAHVAGAQQPQPYYPPQPAPPPTCGYQGMPPCGQPAPRPTCGYQGMPPCGQAPPAQPACGYAGMPPCGQPPPAQPTCGYPGMPPCGQPGVMPTAASTTRDPGEMALLYVTSGLYGVGTGVWIDAVGGVSDPGLALIAPIALGAAAPIGAYFWDQSSTFHRGTPASISTGLALGGLEGVAIAGLQWQATGNGGPNGWGFGTQTTATFLGATAGGVGGYIFGEALHPDPRSLGFIASGAGWGSIAGILFGAGVTPRRENTDSKADWKDYAAPSGFIGYNLGIAATGVLSTVWTPSWQTQKYMWLGFGGGLVASSLVYVFYAFSSAPVWHGLIANSIGGLAGVGLAAALTANLQDAPATPAPGAPQAVWKPPFTVGASRLPEGGAIVNASGTF